MKVDAAMYAGGTVVYAKDGTALGRYWNNQPLVRDEIRFIKDFLCGISKRKEMNMSKTDTAKAETTNMAFIAGIIKTLKIRDSGSAFILVDVGENSKYIPCTIFENEEGAAALGKFREGDFIQVQGYVRAWSQKKDEKWQNSIDVRITHIKNKPPVREQQPKAKRDDFPDWGA